MNPGPFVLHRGHVTPPPALLPAPRTVPEKQPYTAEPMGDGRAILRDERGRSWGIFASEALAHTTAARLSR